MSPPKEDEDKRTSDPVGKIILRKDRLSSIPAEQLRLFLHVLRMINSLRSVHKMHVKIGSGSDRLENFKDRLDLHITGIALYHEAVRTFVGKIYPRIKRSYLSVDHHEMISVLKQRLDSVEDDPFFRIADIIRDKIAFHFDPDVIDTNIIEGPSSHDMLI